MRRAAESPTLTSADGWRAEGAHIEARADWRIAAHYGAPEAEARACTQAVGWSDVSYLTIIALEGSARDLANLAPPGFMEPGAAIVADGRWWCQETAQRILVIERPEPTHVATGTLDHLDRSPSIDTLDVTALHAAILIVGPQARETIARFCALDLRPTVTAPPAFLAGSVARTTGRILCEAEDRYRILCGAAYAAYMWTVISDAATRLGGRVVGVDALNQTAATTTGPQTHA